MAADTTSGLVAFISARLDEDEAAAKAAASVEPEDKKTSRWYGHAQWVAKYGTVVDAGDDDYAMFIESTDEVCAHIARHDPARVLRDVEAKRKILAMAQQEVIDGREVDLDVRDALETVVRYLSAVDCDHPDYDPAWRP